MHVGQAMRKLMGGQAQSVINRGKEVGELGFACKWPYLLAPVSALPF